MAEKPVEVQQFMCYSNYPKVEPRKRFIVFCSAAYRGEFEDESFDTLEAALLYVQQDKENRAYTSYWIFDRIQGVDIEILWSRI